MAKKVLVFLTLMVLTLGLVMPEFAQAQRPIVSVTVVDGQGQPIAGALVTLWNHSATPTEKAGEAVTDAIGEARFTFPEMKGPKEQLTQHLAASVYASGYDGTVTDWSVNRRQAEKAVNGEIRTAELYVPDSRIVVSLEGSGVTTRTSVGETRERLVFSDYTTNARKLTTVAILHQVGDMRSEFQYLNAVRNYISVSTKRASQSGFTVTGEVLTGTTNTNTLTWGIEPTGLDTKYKTRVCQTQFDYRVEEYYVEEFKDRGDGMLDWVKIDSYMKAYSSGVSSGPTPAGSAILDTTAPSGVSVWSDYAPTSGSDWTKSVVQSINGAFEFSWLGMPIKVNVGHTQTTSEQWKFQNTSSTKFYQGGYAAGVWRLRLKP